MLARRRCNNPHATALTYDQLNLAYNCFLRLSQWDELTEFSFEDLAKREIVDIICDGIMMGCKKHFLEAAELKEPHDPTPTRGLTHAQRCHLTAKTRKFFAAYIGLVDGTSIQSALEMSQADYKELLKKKN